jgi:hypothetical protein
MTKDEKIEELYDRCIDLNRNKSDLINILEKIDTFLMYSSLSIEDYEKIKEIIGDMI